MKTPQFNLFMQGAEPFLVVTGVRAMDELSKMSPSKVDRCFKGGTKALFFYLEKSFGMIESDENYKVRKQACVKEAGLNYASQYLEVFLKQS